MQAGAAKVYAIEASGMVQYAQKLLHANPALGARIVILHDKVEAVTLPEKADILISEPMGTLLVNERMLETYVFARRHMLKAGGKMFPGSGVIHAAAFSDEALFAEQLNMAAFWANESFYGVNLTALHADAQAVRPRICTVVAQSGDACCARAVGTFSQRRFIGAVERLAMMCRLGGRRCCHVKSWLIFPPMSTL
jgi:hypothetical protein